MSCKVEKLEKNMAKLTIEATAEQLEAAIEKAYNKNKGKISMPGFRPGKAPRKMIEKAYGKEVFYEDAANELIPGAYSDAVDECGEEVVSQPDIEVVQLEAGKPFIFTATVALKPEVTLGKYKGIKVEKQDRTVTDADIDAELERQRTQNSRTVTVDREAKLGDTAVIDFEGFVDGKAFDGGKGEGYSLELGSHSFIDTFEDQIVGKKAGEEVDVNVTFPEDYQASELAGKPALFKVKVLEVKEKSLPELDDEFASEVSEYDTLAEYKEDIRKEITLKKEKAAKDAVENAVVDAIIEDSKMEIPDPMVETEQKSMIQDYAQRLQMQGLSLDQYFKFTGMTMANMMEQTKSTALKRIQSRLVLEAIVKAENITASDEDYAAEIKKMAQSYQMEEDQLQEMIGEREKKEIQLDICINKAVDLIVAEASEGAAAKKAPAKKEASEEVTEEKEAPKKAPAKKTTATKTTATKTTATKTTATKKAAEKKED